MRIGSRRATVRPCPSRAFPLASHRAAVAVSICGRDMKMAATVFQSFKKGEKPNLGEEMADVLWVLICLANQTGIDLTEELQKSIDKKTQRDAERHKNNPKLKDHNDSKLKE